MRRISPALLIVSAVAAARAETPTASLGTPKARIWSRGQTTWVYRDAKKDKHPLGYIRLGQSLPLRAEEPKKGPGCSGSFYPVEPYGWVCLDRLASVSGDGRWLKAMQRVAPRDGLMPFDYALSNGAPMYRRLPTAAEVAKETAMFGKAGSYKPQSWGNRGHEKLAEIRAVSARHELPWFFENGGSAGDDQRAPDPLRRQIPHGSMLAFSEAFEHEGRTYLLSSDGTAVPADRVRPYRVSDFHGVELGESVKLPLAFMRAKARPKYEQDAEGGMVATGSDWPVRSYVPLDPDADVVESGGKRYLRTSEKNAKKAALFIAEDDATVIRPRPALPIGVAEGAKWIVFSITQGTLAAYDGLTPVFATLASPGAGGVPTKGKSPVKTSSTPLGVYRITFKHRASTMSPEYGENRKFWIADVPYTQYFNAPFALHVAYWHESFGEPMSAGCVNLSPLDGKWLFDWSGPHVPDGWAGAAPGGGNGPATYVVVSR